MLRLKGSYPRKAANSRPGISIVSSLPSLITSSIKGGTRRLWLRPPSPKSLRIPGLFTLSLRSLLGRPSSWQVPVPVEDFLVVLVVVEEFSVAVIASQRIERYISKREYRGARHREFMDRSKRNQPLAGDTFSSFRSFSRKISITLLTSMPASSRAFLISFLEFPGF